MAQKVPVSLQVESVLTVVLAALFLRAQMGKSGSTDRPECKAALGSRGVGRRRHCKRRICRHRRISLPTVRRHHLRRRNRADSTNKITIAYSNHA